MLLDASGEDLPFAKVRRVVDRTALRRYHELHPVCEVCGQAAMPTPHHLRPVSLGGPDLPHNCLSLCATHHVGRDGIHPLGPLRWCERHLHRLSYGARKKVEAAYDVS